MTLYTGFPAQNKQQRPPPLFCILCNACLLFRHELQLSDAVFCRIGREPRGAHLSV